MFTGLISESGTVRSVEGGGGGGSILTVEAPLAAAQLALGDSVAVDGVCLTATGVEGSTFVAEVTNETLKNTTLGDLDAGDSVNIELPLRAGDRFGGHIVQGHIDGTATVTEPTGDGMATAVWVEAGPELLKYIVDRGSVAVNGVSLTVVEKERGRFRLNLIPETLERTNLGKVAEGGKVNLEVDIVAKYTESLLTGQKV